MQHLFYQYFIKINLLISILSLTIPTRLNSQTLDLTKLALINNRNIASRFIIKLKMPFQKQKTIKFGNKFYGYTSKQTTNINGSIYLEFISPGYQKPIDFFYISKRNKLEKIFTKQFTKPNYKFVDEYIPGIRKIVFQKNYISYFLNIPQFIYEKDSIPEKNEHNIYYPVVAVFNKSREIVWLHPLTYSFNTIANKNEKTIITKLHNKGLSILVNDKINSYFETISWNNKIIHNFSSLDLKPATLIKYNFSLKGHILQFLSPVFKFKRSLSSWYKKPQKIKTMKLMQVNIANKAQMKPVALIDSTQQTLITSKLKFIKSTKLKFNIIHFNTMNLN